MDDAIIHYGSPRESHKPHSLTISMAFRQMQHVSSNCVVLLNHSLEIPKGKRFRIAIEITVTF